jgi:hypothetical protein
MLDEAIEHQGAREQSPFLPSFLIKCFSNGSPGCLRIARAVAHHVLIGSTISPISFA